MWSNPAALQWRQSMVSNRLREVLQLLRGPLPNNITLFSDEGGKVEFAMNGRLYTIVYGETYQHLNCLVYRNREYIDPGAYEQLLAQFIAEMKQ